MIKLMAIYCQPQEGEKFDEEYYVKNTCLLSRKPYRESLVPYYAKGMLTPTGDKPPVVGIGIFVWDNIELFKQAMSSPEVQKIRADLPNYSTCRSEVVTFVVEEV